MSGRGGNLLAGSIALAGGALGWALTQGPPVPERSPVSVLPPAVRVVDVMGEGKSNPVISMYAAGIAVMFLLFGATGGGGALTMDA